MTRRQGQPASRQFHPAGGIEFFLRLHGLWEGVIDIAPDPPFEIETFEPVKPPWQPIRECIPNADADPTGDLFYQRPVSPLPVEIHR